MIAALIVGVVLAALAYHALVIAEGTYLGGGVVAFLYDLAAKRYDRIKNVQHTYEAYFLGVPLAERLEPCIAPRVLDVAAGTGRVARSLLPLLQEGATMIGIDLSERMLREAQRACADLPGLTLVQASATGLPLEDATVDAVTCLEALEFVTRGAAAITEMRRVLRPGGVLLASNRVGWEAHLLPGRVARRGVLERMLAQAGFVDVETRRWQVHYDLVWARAPETAVSEAPAKATMVKDVQV